MRVTTLRAGIPGSSILVTKISQEILGSQINAKIPFALPRKATRKNLFKNVNNI